MNQTIMPTTHLDGIHLRQLFQAALHRLERLAPAIDRMNVFPVPDGDTGTNMLLTLRSALDALAHSTDRQAATVAHALARGAMLGARGNSGVILSQILAGFAQALQDRDHVTPGDLARAFQQASEAAYRAVMDPVEGTILTVARAMAEGARHAATEGADVGRLLQQATEAARQALERTPEMLPILKQAGVVDSGAAGLVAILEGMVRALQGEEAVDLPGDATPRPADPLVGAAPAEEELPPTLAEGRYGYDVQYLIHGENLDVAAIRTTVQQMGACPLVVGDPKLVKVHVHVLDPGPVLSLGASLGMLDDVVVENLDRQFQAFAGRSTRPDDATSSATPEPETMPLGVVAVAPGPGLADHFRELGAHQVVLGGQTMNPSTQELLQAIQAVPADAVILLPNNGNIILAARQAQALADRPVHVVPTRSVPQGFAALLALDFSQDPETNVQRMTQAASHVATVDITTAVRDAQINGLQVRAGQVLGLLDDRPVAVGEDEAQVAAQVLAGLPLDEYEVVAVYYGADRTAEEAAAFVQALEARFPELEFQVYPGGQPHYSYICSVE